MVLAAGYHAAVAQSLPVALWRYPGQKGAHFLVDFSGQPLARTIDFTDGRPGFVFAPFASQAGQPPLFLHASLYLHPAGRTLCEVDSPAAPFAYSLFLNNQAAFWESYHAYFRRPQFAPWPAAAHPAAETRPPTATEYQALVARTVAFIKTGAARKVVISRPLDVALPAGFDPLAAFATLGERYPQAFVTLVAIPNIGTWLGASPEILLSLHGDTLKTVALAGTQAHQPTRPLEQVHWGAKEIEEQAVVSEEIRAFFHHAGGPPCHENGPHTVLAGQVVHRQTEFTLAGPPATLLPLANQIVTTLHPTSAVCGRPQHIAREFILAHEGYPREFYSGYLGPLNLSGRSHLHVNLRCMQLKAGLARLYVGGGITADSQPELEWQETVLKAKTLGSILQPNPC